MMMDSIFRLSVFLMKKKLIFLFFFTYISMNGVNAQTVSFYQELLLKNSNNLFPKDLIYDAPNLPISYKDFRRLGFDYISVYSLDNPRIVPNRFKYLLWTGVASNDANAKWHTEKNPFADDIKQYPKRWNARLNAYKTKFNNPYDKDPFGLMILDIEAKKGLVQLEKNPPFRPGGTKNKKKAISDYKIAMEKLYRYPLNFAKSHHSFFNKWSSYSDVPIEGNYPGFANKSWNDWITKTSHLNYITHRTTSGKVEETEFANQLDFYSVSNYFSKIRTSPQFNIENHYLAYTIFQIEVNQAWTGKPIYLYFYFKYQGTNGKDVLINDNMVKNSVIFAFMSGVQGIVLYDDSRKPTNDPNYHNLIKTFVESISILDNYRDYFSGENVVFYKPTNAQNLFVEKKPIVRGIEKNGKVLFAATNPFARENEITRLPINYKGKTIYIQLKGTETKLLEITY